MQADRFTIKSQEALATAGRLAQERRNPQVTPLHLLDALLTPGARGSDVAADAPGGVVLPVLAKMGIDLRAANGELKPTALILREISEGLNRLPEGLKRLYIACDNDRAGLDAGLALATRAISQGIAARLLVPDGKDFNDDLRSLGIASLVQRLRPHLWRADQEH